MATPCIESTEGFILDGLLIQNVANIQSAYVFIGEFDTQKLAVPFFCTVGSEIRNTTDMVGWLPWLLGTKDITRYLVYWMPCVQEGNNAISHCG